MQEHDGLRFLYFDVEHAVKIHDWIIDNSGGLQGVKNVNYIQSPLAHIRNDDYYSSMSEKTTHLVFSINKYHAFNDGNKRASIVLGAYFLELNGYDYCIKRFIHQMENVAVCVASNHISKELLGSIINSLIYEDEYPEALKIELIDAYSKYEDVLENYPDAPKLNY